MASGRGYWTLHCGSLRSVVRTPPLGLGGGGEAEGSVVCLCTISYHSNSGGYRNEKEDIASPPPAPPLLSVIISFNKHAPYIVSAPAALLDMMI